MRSISSSSYEVELSDNCSRSTNCSVDFNSYSNTSTDVDDADLGSTTSALSNNIYTSDYTFRQVISTEEDVDTGYQTETDDQRDDDAVASLPERSTRFERSTRSTSERSTKSELTPPIQRPRRERSDLSQCTIDSGRVLSSSVSSFLTVVDKTVDVVVDALIPLEPNPNENAMQEAQIQKETNKKRFFAAPIALKKSISSFRRQKTDDSSIQSNRSAFSRRSSFRKKQNEQKEIKIGESSGNQNANSEAKTSGLGDKTWNASRQERKVGRQDVDSADTKRNPFTFGSGNGDGNKGNGTAALNNRIPVKKTTTGLKSEKSNGSQAKGSVTPFTNQKSVRFSNNKNAVKPIPATKGRMRFNSIKKKKVPQPEPPMPAEEEKESALDVFFKGMGFPGYGASNDSNENFFFEEEQKKKKKLFKRTKKKSEKQHLLQRKTKRGYIRNE